MKVVGSTCLLLAIVLTCGLEAASGQDASWTVEQESASASATATDAAGATGTTPQIDDDDDLNGPGGPTTCPSLCTGTSSCSKSCRVEGAYTTCGNHGVCVDCASYCTTGAYCAAKACMQDGVLTSCQATGRDCHPCHADSCDGSPLGCGDGRTCMRRSGTRSSPARSYQTCESWAATTGDRDLDRVPDSLEQALARRFFPVLNMRYPLPPTGCTGSYPYEESCDYFNKDSYGQFYGNTLSYEFGGGATYLPYAVRPYQDSTSECDEDFECLEIAYTLLYNYDYGDDFSFDDGHQGDSESVAVLVSRNVDNLRRGVAWSSTWDTARLTDAAWGLIKVNAAAHMCAGGQPTFYNDLDGNIYTRVWNGPGSTLLVPDEEPLGSTPFGGLSLWVAEFKGATYFSQYRCNVGNAYWDDCTTDRRWLTAAEHAAAQADLINAGESGCHANFTSYIQGPSWYPPLTGPNSGYSASYPIWGSAKFGKSSPLFHKLESGTFKWDVYDYVCY